MALIDLLEIGDLLLSWRLYVGIAITFALCWLVFQATPSETIRWTACAPIGIAGVLLSFRWQINADSGK